MEKKSFWQGEILIRIRNDPPADGELGKGKWRRDTGRRKDRKKRKDTYNYIHAEDAELNRACQWGQRSACVSTLCWNKKSQSEKHKEKQLRKYGRKIYFWLLKQNSTLHPSLDNTILWLVRQKGSRFENTYYYYIYIYIIYYSFSVQQSSQAMLAVKRNLEHLCRFYTHYPALTHLSFDVWINPFFFSKKSLYLVMYFNNLVSHVMQHQRSNKAHRINIESAFPLEVKVSLPVQTKCRSHSFIKEKKTHQIFAHVGHQEQIKQRDLEYPKRLPSFETSPYSLLFFAYSFLSSWTCT